MTDMLYEKDRLRRLAELQRDMEKLHARMRILADEINLLMEQAGVRGPRTDDSPGGWTVRARVQSLGALTVRYGWRERDTGKLKYRTWLVEPGKDGNPDFLFRLPEPHMKQLLDLDTTRRLLNHRSRTIYGEHQSLKRLHQSHEDLDQALTREASGS